MRLTFIRLLLKISLLLCIMTAVADPNPAPGFSTCPANYALFSTYTTLLHTTDWGKNIGWVSSPINMCKGYFTEPSAITAVPNPAPINTTLTTIKASGPTHFSQVGTSTLEQVVVTQPGRQLIADQATLYRDEQTGKINRIDLTGHVSFREAGKMLYGNFIRLNLDTNTASLSETGAYHVRRPSNTSTIDAWGTTDQAIKLANGNLQLYNSSYTTCSPTQPSWFLKAEDLYLNKITGRGIAHNAWFYAHQYPLFYSPYVNFPIDKRRYSGFLYPSPDYDSDSGFILNIPYYFNLAPNFDDTFTVSPMFKRGVQMTNLFRFLTDYMVGDLVMGVLPYDSQFATFRANELAPYDDKHPPPASIKPYIDQLANDSNTRAAVSFKDRITANENWSGLADVNLVSDAYYLQDLGTLPQMVNTDQLLNQAEVDYQNPNWQVSARVQAYQTLHTINNSFVADQYQRLPELDINANYPNQLWGMDFILNSAFANFQHVDDFFTDEPFPTGNRVHLNPAIQRAFLRSWGYLTPSLQLDVTGYSVSNNGLVNQSGSAVIPINPDLEPDDPNYRPSLNKVRTLPIFDLDGGLYFDSLFSVFNHTYRQTLEPRAYYLFVPAVNQFEYPLFDTSLPSFSYDMLFRPNRFVGLDRVGDANQISLGVTTRLLDDYNGAQRADASIGEAFYFRKHTVCLYPDCRDDPTIDDQVSPIAGLLNLYLTPQWTLTGSAAFDPNQGQMNNYSARLHYKPAPQFIITAGYNYVLNGDVLSSQDDTVNNNLSRIDLGAAIPITEHWSTVGDWNYNISHQHPQTYFYGLQYDTCCWAVRLVANRLLTADNINNGAEFTNKIYLQFLLKGLGSVGNSAGSNLLTTTFPGYVDPFRS
ncbi:MAG: LPS assembly protein LptD [Gammaproteobacteria bacterium]